MSVSKTRAEYIAWYRHMRLTGGQRFVDGPVEQAAYQSFRAYEENFYPKHRSPKRRK